MTTRQATSWLGFEMNQFGGPDCSITVYMLDPFDMDRSIDNGNHFNTTREAFAWIIEQREAHKAQAEADGVWCDTADEARTQNNRRRNRRLAAE